MKKQMTMQFLEDCGFVEYLREAVKEGIFPEDVFLSFDCELSEWTAENEDEIDWDYAKDAYTEYSKTRIEAWNEQMQFIQNKLEL